MIVLLFHPHVEMLNPRFCVPQRGRWHEWEMYSAHRKDGVVEANIHPTRVEYDGVTLVCLQR